MSVIKMSNGGSLQIRTGVLQGIGPVGPIGLTGPKGQQGDTGPSGPTGPMGQILQYNTTCSVGAALALSADTDTLVSFPTVVNDDLSAATSSTNYTIANTGVYSVAAWVRFDLPGNSGDGIRMLWVNSSTRGVLARNSTLAVVDEATYLQVNWPGYYNAGEILNIKARHGDDLSVGITLGSLSITRIGSGPAGPQGPQGPSGPVGPAGPVGPKGNNGSAGSGYTTYADLLPH